MSQSSSQPQPESGFQPGRTNPVDRSRRRRPTAAQRRKNRLRLLYIVVAIFMVLFMLSGIFASFVPRGG